jgi:LysR family nitrogen assimilation transcriptional regulator
MEPKHLRSFLAIVENGSFTAAARALDLPQPAVSQHLLSLESSLGTRLFERSRRGARLTNGGEKLLPHARLILENLQRARDEVSGLDREPGGHISLGLPQSVAMAIAARLVLEVHARFPAIRLRIVEALSGHLHEWVDTGRVDFAVLFAGDGLPEAVGQKLKTESLSLVGSPSRMMEFGRVVAARRAAQLPLIIPGAPHGLRLVINHAFGKVGMTPGAIQEIDSAEAIKTLVINGGRVPSLLSLRTPRAKSWPYVSRSVLTRVSLRLWRISPSRSRQRSSRPEGQDFSLQA